MRISIAIAGSIVHFMLAPGIVAGVIPYTLTSWRLEPQSALQLLTGGLLIVAAVPLLVACFWCFVQVGRGTPAPIAPTDHLVVAGPYRYVRNPMYLAVIGMIFGQALIFDRGSVLLYGAIAGAAMAGFSKLHEEPYLLMTFGADYAEYRRNVPAWFPRLTPWDGMATRSQQDG